MTELITRATVNPGPWSLRFGFNQAQLLVELEATAVD